MYLLLRKSRPKKSRDLKYIIKAHTQRGGSKYISFVEKVKTEENLRNKMYHQISHTAEKLQINIF
jgi:hypothetical protein